MGSSLSIERRSGSEHDRTPIDLDEWKAAVCQVEHVRLSDRPSIATNPRTGEQVMVPHGDGDAEVYFHKDGKWYQVFQYGHGCVYFKWTPSFEEPEDPVRKIVITLTSILGAKLFGPEDEPYPI